MTELNAKSRLEIGCVNKPLEQDICRGQMSKECHRAKGKQAYSLTAVFGHN